MRVAVLCLLSLTVVLGAAAGAGMMAMKSSDTVFTETVTVAAGAGGVSAWLRCGAEGLKVELTAPSGVQTGLTLRPFAACLPATSGAEAETLPEAGVELVELRVKRYVRPNPVLLKGAARERCVKDWTALPGALAHVLLLTLVQEGEDVACYLDGQYAGKAVRGARLGRVAFTVPPGSGLGATAAVGERRGRFVPVELRGQDQPGAMAGAEVRLEPGAVPEGLGLEAVGEANLDLGVTARQQDAYANYTHRSGYDGLRESFIFTVPSAQYIRAWVLCAAEPGKDRALTGRLTRFVGQGPYTGRARDCLADTTVVLPKEGELLPPGVKPVGTVTAQGQQAPLYLVELSLASGEIQDLIFAERERQRGTLPIGPYLDFELLGRLRPADRPHPFEDDRYYPDKRTPSGVHVFGVTLEKTPVEMEVRQTQPGNVFVGEEPPELVVTLRPQEAGEYEVRWEMRDVVGQSCGQGRKRVKLAAGEAEQTLPVSLRQPQPGWYQVNCAVWEGERELVRHPAACALLPPDTRQAGYESPYATWWFDHHYGTSDPKIAGPLLLKGGFRRAAYAVARHTEEELAPWKVTAAAVSWGSLNRPQATDEELEAAIRKTVEAYPHCDNVLIFHESMPRAPLGTRTAPELVGLAVQEYEGAEERWALATRLARLVRAKFPQLKIFIGNSGASSELIAEGLRRKFPREYADFVGVETVGRTGHPERLWEGGLPGVWLLREVGRKFGVPWPVTSCYETNYRQERLLGDQRHAEWYVRDLLLSQAYRFPYISTALLYDAGNSYHASFWGSTGLCRRYPLLYPKPAYVAMATATRVLDRVTLRREMPTGSNSVYALEFARGDGKNVYPVWTARGTAELSLAVGGSGPVEVVDLYGRSQTVKPAGGKVKLTAGTAVQYVIADRSVTGMNCGRRACPEDRPPQSFRIANDMADPTQWELASEEDPLLEQTRRPHLPFRTAGKFVLRGLRDAETGPCLEVELVPRKDLPTPLLTQYGKLRLKTPVTLPGEPTALGMWVKGNSGWGQVYFEVEDAAGVRRVSCGTVVHDADVFDYDGRMSVNFDGWAYLSFPLTDQSRIPDLSTGSVTNLWESTDRSKPVRYPVKLTGVAFAVPQECLHLTEMQTVRQVLRLGGVGSEL